MKDIEEIKKTSGMSIDGEGEDGMMGRLFPIEYKNGKVKIVNKEDKVCMQLHPRKEDYVNNHPHCLHIWKPINKKIPTPPSIMVGLKNLEK